MKKLIITSILLMVSLIFMLSTAISQDIARLKSINILENTNSIELNLTSSNTIPYNIIYYMNGDIGIKLTNTMLAANINDVKHISIGKQTDISAVNIHQDGPYSLEVLISGNGNIKNKEIKVNNDIRKSNIILIEPVQEDKSISFLPLVKDMPELPEATPMKFTEVPTKSDFDQDHEKLTISKPISMLSQESDVKDKKLIAQAQPYDDDTSILDLGDENLAKPLSKTTNTSSAEKINDTKETTKPSMATSTSSSEVPPDQTVDALNVNNATPEPEVTNAKNPGIFSTIMTFVKEKWKWLAGGGVCVIGLIIAIVVIAFMFNNSRAPESVTEEGEAYQDTPPQKQQEAAPIVDNEPVTYIPPSQIPSSQSIGDAINNIISIRNKSGK